MTNFPLDHDHLPLPVLPLSTGSLSSLELEYPTVLGNAGVSPALSAQRKLIADKKIQQIGHRAGGDARVPKSR
jgi:hypothetical protein